MPCVEMYVIELSAQDPQALVLLRGALEAQGCHLLDPPPYEKRAWPETAMQIVEQLHVLADSEEQIKAAIALVEGRGRSLRKAVSVAFRKVSDRS